MSDFEAEDLIGELINGRYAVEAVIGTGSAAVVYQAVDHVLGRRVAIKVLSAPPGTRGLTAFERFRLEAHALAQLGHPNIVAIYDTGRTASGRPFLVMERLHGMSLHERLASRGHLSIDEVFQVAAQLCRALRRAHASGVIHRDIKPSNVMVTDEDGELFVKILDFGVARLMVKQSDDPSESPTHLTNHGNLVGSPLYMSPEQIVGDEVDPRSDVYSLGVTLFHLLTGRPPFDGQTAIDVLRQHLQGEAASIGDVAPDVQCPPRLEAVITRCLSKFREARQPSMDALLAELRVAWVEYAELRATPTPDLPLVRWTSEVVDFSAVEVSPLPDVILHQRTDEEEISHYAPTLPPPPLRRLRRSNDPFWPWLLVLGAGLLGGAAVASALAGLW